MIFFGFGFLMTFLRRYGYSAVGYTLVISAIVTQYSIVVRGVLFNLYNLGHPPFGGGTEWTRFPMTIRALIDGLFCSGAVMISFGAILGKTSPTQLLIMALIEPWFYFANVVVSTMVLQAIDVGGGNKLISLLFIHILS